MQSSLEKNYLYGVGSRALPLDGLNSLTGLEKYKAMPRVTVRATAAFKFACDSSVEC